MQNTLYQMPVLTTNILSPFPPLPRFFIIYQL
jgi:hypothetical protein